MISEILKEMLHFLYCIIPSIFLFGIFRAIMSRTFSFGELVVLRCTLRDNNIISGYVNASLIHGIYVNRHTIYCNGKFYKYEDSVEKVGSYRWDIMKYGRISGTPVKDKDYEIFLKDYEIYKKNLITT